jgi:hypothetical protein
MPISPDPEQRAKQIAALQPGHTVHGAYAAAVIQPETQRILDVLLKRFTGVPRDRLEVLAQHRARITVLAAYVAEKGVLRNRRLGEVFPAVSLLAREEDRYRRELDRIEELSRGSGESADEAVLDRLIAVGAEIQAKRKGSQ